MRDHDDDLYENYDESCRSAVVITWIALTIVGFGGFVTGWGACLWVMQ